MRFLVSIICIGVVALVGCERQSQTSCLANLRMIDGAKEMWAREHHKTTNGVPTWEDLAVGPNRYLKDKPECPAGGTYTIGRVDELPRCSFPDHAARYKDRF